MAEKNGSGSWVLDPEERTLETVRELIVAHMGEVLTSELHKKSASDYLYQLVANDLIDKDWKFLSRLGQLRYPELDTEDRAVSLLTDLCEIERYIVVPSSLVRDVI